MKKTITKMQRLLSGYHLLCFCQEVSMKELTDCLLGSVKTFSRDLVLLRRAGVPVIYSQKRKAFLLEEDGFKEMCLPDNLAQTRMWARLR